MQILITGAAGFIGQLVAEQLLNDSLYKVTLSDVIEPPIPKGVKHPQNATALKADLYESASSVVSPSLDAVYVFHGIMSAGSESNFELGMRVNVDATRRLFDELRQTCPGVRVIYASSQAVYGQPLPETVTDAVTPTPESSYGAEKMMCEMLVNDYTRRGFINGISLRFPTISVRPGKPSAAASSFLSGMIREPLSGLECVIPMKDRNFRSWVGSPRVLVENLIFALTIPRDALPSHTRSVNVPGMSVTVQEMMDALAKVAGKDKLELLKEEEDPALIPILHSWPTRFDNSTAYKIGFKKDSSFEQAVRDYKDSLG